MVNKNDIIEIEIIDQGTTGEGIGKVDGYTLFVKDGVIGDEVTVKVMKANKNFGFARLMEIKKPSKDRVTPRCSVARQCGGCQIQCLSYEEQLKFKQNKVYNNLVRIGGQNDFVMQDIIGMEEPFNYRNKAQFPVGLDKQGNVVSGFYAGRTHSIIGIDSCDLGLKLDGRDINKEVMDIVKKFMTKYQIEPYNEVTHKGLVRHVLIRIGAKTKQIMVCIIINGRKLPNKDELVEKLCKLEGMQSVSLNVNTNKSNVILGSKIINLYGPGYIEDYIGDVKFRISPLSFFQVNPVQTEKLYNKALEYADLSGNEIVWDLYCGIGSISLFLAKKAKKVLGVEIVPEAIEDARLNAKINKIDNFEVAFDNFNIDKIINYDENKVNNLLLNKGIIRNKNKILASINNSRIFKSIVNEYGSFYKYLCIFTKDKIYYENNLVTSQLSDAISKDLQKRGMKFVGSTIIYSFLQAVGIIYSHEKECFLYKSNV